MMMINDDNNNVEVWGAVLLVSCVILNIAAILLLLRCPVCAAIVIIFVIVAAVYCHELMYICQIQVINLSLKKEINPCVTKLGLIDRNVACRITQEQNSDIADNFLCKV